MKATVILTVTLAFVCTFLVYTAFTEEQITEENKIMSNWLKWKVNHVKDTKEKKIIECLKKIDTSFNVAKETQFVTNKSDYGNPNPKKALRIIQNSLTELQRLKVPKECMRYYELTIKILQNIKNYHISRINLGDGEVFWEKIKTDKLNQIKMEAERESEYFNVLRDIGFYDSMLEEMSRNNQAFSEIVGTVK